MPRIAACLLALAGAACAAGAPPEFVGGWMREAPPGARVLAAYGTLRNPGDRAVVVTGVRCPGFDRAAVHEMSMVDGVMKMKPLEQLALPPHADVVLEPGARHLMLFEPKRAPKAGDRLELELTLQDGSTIEATVDVR